jgi:hypothetical protein
MTDPSKLIAEANAISTASPKLRIFAQDAAANIVDLAARVAALEHAAPTPTPAPSAAYFTDDLTAGLAQWSQEISTPQGGTPLGTITTGAYGGVNGAALTSLAEPFDGATGQMESIYLPNTAARAAQFLGGVEGQEAWFRFGVLFPAGTKFTTGQWNLLTAWHDDAATSQTPGAVSTNYSVFTDYPVAATPGLNPRLALRVYGGPVAANPVPVQVILPDVILYDHRYDYLTRIVWGTTATTGRFEWWLDGVQRYAASVPTLYKHTDGTLDRPTFGLYNYRLKAPWVATTWFSGVAIGPTRASVGA